MSLIFSNSTEKTGIVELIDDNCKSNSTSYPLKNKTRDINLAIDKVLSIIFGVGGTWQFDDSNHLDYPIITTNLISGQRDYSFVNDEQGNLVLDIYKVMVKNVSGVFQEIYPVDVQSEPNTESFFNGVNAVGVPQRYDKTANGFFLDPVPDSTIYTDPAVLTNALKVYINREGSYFSTSDTTKKPGFAGDFHEYLALRPSYFYAMRNGLKNKNDLKSEMLEMEKAIAKHYGQRERDVDPVLRSANHFDQNYI
jgi:hypothetical protein